MTSDQVTARLETYRERLAEAPESGVFIALADLLRATGDFDEALAILGRGMAARPESVSAAVVMGRTLLEAGRASEARTVLGSSLERDPDNTLALRLMAEVCSATSDWAAAVPALERLIELEPEESRWRSALDEARAQREITSEGHGEASAGFATMTLVDIYVSQGYHARALAALRQMLEDDPERTEIRERIDELQGLVDASPGDPEEQVEPPSPTPEAPAAEGPPGPAEERRRARAEQKEQFTRWLDQVSRNEGQDP